MKALIIGINGQDGFYLKQLLHTLDIEVIGVSRSEGNWIKGNVSNADFVNNIIKSQKPDYIFHFAANSTTSHQALFENHETIATGTLNILEAVYNYTSKTKVFITGSGLQFINDGKPIKETDTFIANSPNSVARIQSVYAARYYRSLGIKTYVGYLFNHDSPKRTERHVNQKIVKAVLRMAKGSNEIIELTDINVQKEFAFAGDIIEAIWLFINQDRVFETVIGTGITYSIKDWLNICFKMKGLDWKNKVKIHNDFISPYKLLVSNPETIKKLGWQPKINIEHLAEMMINEK